MKQTKVSGLPAQIARRQWIQQAAVGTVLSTLGGLYVLGERADASAAELRKDGRPRLPPGQRPLRKLRPMGGQAGSPLRKDFRLTVSGLVQTPLSLSFEQLVSAGAVELSLDVHCVTGWSVLGARFRGVRLQKLAERAGVKPEARHVVFEAAHGYTANVPLKEALKPEGLLAFDLEGRPLARAHGAPVRAVVPGLYFWKSAKWIKGVRFVARDEPGYWEVRGYNNHGDPWREERYS